MKMVEDPAFWAYSRLTLIAHGHNQLGTGGTAKMSYHEFKDCLEKAEVVNSDLVQPLPAREVEFSELNAKYQHRYDEQSVLRLIEKAYNLGLVAKDGELASLPPILL